MPGDLARTELRWFTILNQINFIFGIFYTIYQIFMTIFNGFSAVFTVFIFLFCAALLISSGLSNKLKNHDKGICIYFVITLGLLAWVIILVVIAFVNGVGSFWSIIVVVCWCLLLFSLLMLTYFSYKVMKGGNDRY